MKMISDSSELHNFESQVEKNSRKNQLEKKANTAKDDKKGRK